MEEDMVERFFELIPITASIPDEPRTAAVVNDFESRLSVELNIVVGTSLGVWISQLFIPYLQIGETATAYIPPYIVEIAWPEVFRIYVLFGLLFVAALGALSALLMRIKIFQAVKLGETT